MNLYKNKTIQKVNKYFPITFFIFAAVLFSVNQICVLAGVL